MRSIVLAPFFSHEASANRPLLVSEVLARFGPVDIVTTDFDHLRKTRKPRFQFPDGRRAIHYLATPRYSTNVSVARFLSHGVFSVRAFLFLRRRASEYDVIYATLPLNLLANLAFRAGARQRRIADVVDIWPAVLPFPARAKRLLRPLLALWQRTFVSAVAASDVLMAVSDRFLQESLPAFRGRQGAARRFYIGYPRLPIVPRPSRDRLTIAYIGNIGQLCDLDAMLDAADRCPTPPRVLLVGDGDRRAWLVDELARRRIPHEYFGVIYDDEVIARILARADFGFNGYLNTSAAFSYKANTYLAAGLPLLNSMGGDLHEIVERERLGFNYAPRDGAGLARCLQMVTPHLLEQLRANAQRFFAASLDQEQVKRELHEYFEQILAPMSRASGERRAHGDAAVARREDPSAR